MKVIARIWQRFGVATMLPPSNNSSSNDVPMLVGIAGTQGNRAIPGMTMRAGRPGRFGKGDGNGGLRPSSGQ
jgi:hypothetical protein